MLVASGIPPTVRLASLLWRSRCAILIETVLSPFRRKSCAIAAPRARRPHPSEARRRLYRRLNGATVSANPDGHDQSKIEDNYDGAVDHSSAGSSRALTHCFLRLANLESGARARQPLRGRPMAPDHADEHRAAGGAAPLVSVLSMS